MPSSPATPTLSVSFNVGKQDVLELASHYYATSPSIRRMRLATQIVLALSFVTLGLLLLLQTHDLVIVAIECLVGVGLSIFLFPALHRRSLRWTANKMLTETPYQKAFGNYTLTFGEDGFTSISPIGEAKYNWRAIDSIALTPDYLFIFIAGPQGIPIPRTQISEPVLKELSTFLESHIGASH